VATKPHTALDREQARIVVVCAIRRRTASGDHTDALTKIVENQKGHQIKSLPQSQRQVKTPRKIERGQGILKRGGRHFPEKHHQPSESGTNRHKERVGECAAGEADCSGKIPGPKVFHVDTEG
jgi:hypothetical protein